MTLRLLSFLILLIAAGPASAQPASLDHAHIATEALRKHIQPAYRRLTEAFDDMRKSAVLFCRTPGKAKLKDLQDRFAEAVRAWGAIAHIYFGPVRTGNRYERIWFWPDRKAIGQRQVLSALRDKPADYLDAATLSGKSIAVQGLGALEHVLYGPLANPEPESDAFACDYAVAIAANLTAIASEVEAEWRDDGAFAKLWLSPGPENRVYLSAKETTFALIRILMEHLERVRDTELARPLGVTQSRRVLPGPFSESGLTMAFIAARIAGLHSLFVDTGVAGALEKAARVSGNADATAEIEQALFELRLLKRSSAELAAIPDVLGDAPERTQAVALGFPLRTARRTIANAAGRLTDLPVGFNASDGD